MTTWTLRDLQAVPLRERGLTVGVCTLHRVVHALGYRYRRPRHDLRHRQDAQAVAAAKRVLDWLPKKSLPASGRSAAAGSPALGPPVVYVDECEIHPHPHLAQVWRKQGQPMSIPAAGADRKCAIFGALDYASGQLLQTIPSAEAVGVVLDNAGYHTSLAMREWWRAHAAQLQPFFLPADTPQLNLIERLWRYLKGNLACHRWWNDLQRLQQAAATLLTGLEVHFHATDGPTFRPPHNFCETA